MFTSIGALEKPHRRFVGRLRRYQVHSIFSNYGQIPRMKLKCIRILTDILALTDHGIDAVLHDLMLVPWDEIGMVEVPQRNPN
jgi:hypothetical protein